MAHEQGKGVGQTGGQEIRLKWDTTSGNTIRRVLESELDLTIAQIKSNGRMIACP